MYLGKPHSHHTDAVVIGGGIIGSAIALRLAQSGLSVSVFDRGPAGGEASSAAAGMIAPQSEKTGSPEFDELCRFSHGLYSEFAAEIESLSDRRVNYRRDGTLLVALSDEQARELEEAEHDASARSESAPGAVDGLRRTVERLDSEAARQRIRGLADDIQGALFLPGDHWVDNERLTAAVIEAARRHGVVFQEHTPVQRIHVRGDRVEGIETPGEQLSAGEVILAAGCWSGALAVTAGIELPTEPCRGQMMELELDSALPMVVRAGHHYLVPREGKLAVVGTTAEYVGFNRTVTAGGLADLVQAAARMAPFVAGGRFRRAWAGLRPDTADHLPVLGRCGVRGLTLATGHYRNGILLAPVTARLIADLVVKGSLPRLIEPFRADRFALEAKA
jgi:glycine oxidase